MISHLVKAFIAAARVVALLLVTASATSAFPERPIRIVVPFTAGGAVDVVARIIAPKLGLRMGAEAAAALTRFMENGGGRAAAE